VAEERNAFPEINDQNFDLLLERCLGDKKKIEETREIFRLWKPVRDEVT
jgi:hypothetical protein